MADISLKGKVALVTGAGSPIGLGRHMVLALTRAGARVALLDRREDWLRETAKELGGLPIVGDITDPRSAENAVATTLRELGGLHILVNNAGTSPIAEGLVPASVGRNLNFWDIPVEAWQRVVAVNFSGAFYMSRAAVPHLRAQKWGRLISVTTSLDTMYLKGNAPYGPSKAGHEALVATMAQELEGSGVTANVLTPGGGSDTNLIPSTASAEYRAKLIRPEVMQAPVVWLASDASNGFSGRRIIAARWKASAPVEENLANSAAPAAWPQLGNQAIRQ